MKHLKITEHDNLLNWALLVLLVGTLLIVGCSSNKVTPTKPVDVAAESGKQITKAFLLVYDTAKTWTEKGTPKQKEYALTKLNPAVNRVKPLVAEFDRAVAHWQRTGLAGDDVIAKQKELEKLYDELQRMIIDAFAEKEA